MFFVWMTTIVDLRVELVYFVESFDLYPYAIREINGEIEVIGIFIDEGWKWHEARACCLGRATELIYCSDNGWRGLFVYKDAEKHAPCWNRVAAGDTPRRPDWRTEPLPARSSTVFRCPRWRVWIRKLFLPGV